ncbi:PPE family protein [Mycobacterium sp. pUA109]|uniref:PPE family protein n=1 Tax=Mycobacterium sp. pUA109 TaxID=3238982 RepID=UPI00351BDFDD
MDFATLPPEVNSAKMYSGPGSGPMLAAASAWDGLATELYSTAASYGSVLSALTSQWVGPSSAAMAGAAAPYASWMVGTAAQAEQTALQAKAAAGAYEAAFAATVPPPVIAANRSLLATLVATNILGQNTPAIAATEAHYAEMWAQDAAAMFGYADAAAAATQLTPFTSPPQTTNDSGVETQSVAVAQATGTSASSNVQTQLSQLISQVPNTLQSLTTNATSTSASSPLESLISALESDLESSLSSLSSIINTVAGPYTPIGIAGNFFRTWWSISSMIPGLGGAVQSVPSTLTAKTVTGALGPLASAELSGAPALQPAGLGGGAVSGAMSRAGLVGSLSVPTNWAAATPAVQTMAKVSASAGLDAAPAIAAEGQEALFSEMAASSLAGRAFGATAGRAVGGVAARITGGVVTKASPTTATIIVVPPPIAE